MGWVVLGFKKWPMSNSACHQPTSIPLAAELETVADSVHITDATELDDFFVVRGVNWCLDQIKHCIGRQTIRPATSL